MLETGGSLPVKDVNQKVMVILDLKCPSSKMMKKNLYENLKYIKTTDEIKFVMGTREDYEWTKEIIKKYNLKDKCGLLASVVFGSLEPLKLVEWILEDNLKIRFQLQMHKFIWEPNAKGV
jgi:7-carboxy-7-deazaguanine synthase